MPIPSHQEIPREFRIHLPLLLERLNLTEDQKAKLKSIEENFAKTYEEFNRDEIEVAQKAIDQATAER